MIEEIQGDLLDTDCLIIAHGVNCQGVMGAGVAKAIATKWPKVKECYMDYFLEFNAGLDGENFLGQIENTQTRPGDKVVVNCFTQQYYGPGDKLYLSYDALLKCMKHLKSLCAYYGVNEVAMPKIGCGLAGGDWNIVKAILESVFPQNFTVKVYVL